MEIKNKKGNIIYTSEEDTMIAAVVEAVNRSSDLSGADLRRADLRRAHLSGAYLSGAELSGADLSGADLRGAYLSGADLRRADLRCADLRRAHLSGAELSGADLSGAYLYGAYLYGAYLSGAINIPYIPLACPSDGAFVGWKKVNGLLVKLLIPDDARRSSATKNKCRCDKAQVIGITSIDGKNSYDKETNWNYGHETVYEVGKMVIPDSFDDNRWNECSNGIHFFINKQDAINF